MLVILILSGCHGERFSPQPVDSQVNETLEPPVTLTSTTVISTPVPAPTDGPRLTYWIDPDIPQRIRDIICVSPEFQQVASVDEAGMQLVAGSGQVLASQEMFALAGRFSLLTDEVSLAQVQQAWSGEGVWVLEMSQATLTGFEKIWGRTNSVRIVNSNDSLRTDLWANPNTLALIPFDKLTSDLKVLRVDGLSPLQKDLDISRYPLKVEYAWQGDDEVLAAWKKSCKAVTNRDENLMTGVLMTGVTALTRGTAARMVEVSVTYPAEKILDWLRSADFTHISNEVSFYSACPLPLPLRAGGRFCSQTDFINLLTYAGVDIVELTGNHLNDWGTKAMTDSLAMYQQAGLLTFGGGVNAEAARQPLLIEHHGNRLAFIGCNSVGPKEDWATDNQPGAAQCDIDWLSGEVAALKANGYLPIVTFQGFELCEFKPHSTQREAAQRMVEAGAVIVSGSQAHCPQAYDIQGDTFIHYGLGNLWFDQMDWITRQELLDRHIFYAGRHISTEVLTAMLEDSAQPRPMTDIERKTLLEMLFQASGW